MKAKQPKPRGEEPEQDNWFVDLFDGVNQDIWDRQSGDKLTFWQRVTIAGQLFTITLVIVLALAALGYMVTHLEMLQIKPN